MLMLFPKLFSYLPLESGEGVGGTGVILSLSVETDERIGIFA